MPASFVALTKLCTPYIQREEGHYAVKNSDIPLRWVNEGAVMPANVGIGVRRAKAAFPSGCKPLPAKCSHRNRKWYGRPPFRERRTRVIHRAGRLW
jgi:hypothetical protein